MAGPIAVDSEGGVYRPSIQSTLPTFTDPAGVTHFTTTTGIAFYDGTWDDRIPDTEVEYQRNQRFYPLPWGTVLHEYTPNYGGQYEYLTPQIIALTLDESNHVLYGICGAEAGHYSFDYATEGDTGSHFVFKLDLRTGDATMLVGVWPPEPRPGDPNTWRSVDGAGTSARLTPWAVDVQLGPDGALWVNETIAIRRVDIAAGTITTIAGFSGDFKTQPFLDNGFLFWWQGINDAAHWSPHRIMPGTIPVVDGPAHDARFVFVRGMAFRGDDLYIFDQGPAYQTGVFRHYQFQDDVIRVRKLTNNVVSTVLEIPAPYPADAPGFRWFARSIGNVVLDPVNGLFYAIDGMDRKDNGNANGGLAVINVPGPGAPFDDLRYEYLTGYIGNASYGRVVFGNSFPVGVPATFSALTNGGEYMNAASIESPGQGGGLALGPRPKVGGGFSRPVATASRTITRVSARN